MMRKIRDLPFEDVYANNRLCVAEAVSTTHTLVGISVYYLLTQQQILLLPYLKGII